MFSYDHLVALKNKPLIEYLKKMLPNTLGNHKDVILRLGSSLQTEKDLVNFASMINEIYAEGYTTAFNHCKSKLEERGINFSITKPNTNPQN